MAPDSICWRAISTRLSASTIQAWCSANCLGGLGSRKRLPGWRARDWCSKEANSPTQQIRQLFESHGIFLQEWDKVHTDRLTIRQEPIRRELHEETMAH